MGIRLVLTAAILLLLSACAKEKEFDFDFAEGVCSGNPQVGKWANSTDTLYISGDCRGAQKLCDLRFTYTTPFENGYQTVVTVTDSNGLPGCMDVGIHSCNITLYNSDNSAQLMCDAIPETYYDRQ